MPDGEASMEDVTFAGPCWGEEREFDFVGVIYRCAAVDCCTVRLVLRQDALFGSCLLRRLQAAASDKVGVQCGGPPCCC